MEKKTRNENGRKTKGKKIIMSKVRARKRGDQKEQKKHSRTQEEEEEEEQGGVARTGAGPIGNNLNNTVASNNNNARWRDFIVCVCVSQCVGAGPQHKNAATKKMSKTKKIEKNGARNKRRCFC